MNDLDTIHQRITDARAPSRHDRGIQDDALERRKFGQTRILRALLLLVTVLVICAGVGIGFYEFPTFAETLVQATSGRKATPSAGRPTDPPAQQPPPQPTSASANLFTSHAVQAGASRCAATYSALGKALTGGTAFMVQTQTAKVDADGHALQGIVGMTFTSANGGYSGPAAGLVFASPTQGGCEGTMVRSVPLPQDCQAVVALLPKGSAPMGPLSGIPLYALSSGGELMLIPAGNGCVAMTVARSGG